jgi:glutamate racemase
MTDPKKPLIGLIHSTRMVIEPVHSVIASQCPDADLFHIMDEGLLRTLIQLGEITERITSGLTRLVSSAESTGADLAIVSCSSWSPAVNAVRRNVGISVLKIDEPMVEYAVQHADRIGLMMTLPTTETPSKMLVNEVSEKFGKKIAVKSRIESKAFFMQNRGEIENHDNIVMEGIENLLKDVDLVLLAQISIARILKKLNPDIRKKVFSSLDFIGPKLKDTLSKK